MSLFRRSLIRTPGEPEPMLPPTGPLFWLLCRRCERMVYGETIIHYCSPCIKAAEDVGVSPIFKEMGGE